MWIYLSEVVLLFQRPASFFNFQFNILSELCELVEVFFWGDTKLNVLKESSQKSSNCKQADKLWGPQRQRPGMAFLM